MAKPWLSYDGHPVVRESKLIIPTTIPKFTAVERNILARETKCTAEYSRVSLLLRFLFLFSLFFFIIPLLLPPPLLLPLLLFSLLFLRARACPGIPIETQHESPAVTRKSARIVEWILPYFTPSGERKNGDDSLSEACETGPDWKKRRR